MASLPPLGERAKAVAENDEDGEGKWDKYIISHEGTTHCCCNGSEKHVGGDEDGSLVIDEGDNVDKVNHQNGLSLTSVSSKMVHTGSNLASKGSNVIPSSSKVVPKIVTVASLAPKSSPEKRFGVRVYTDASPTVVRNAEGLYECEMCPKTFRDNSNFRKHWRRMHQRPESKKPDSKKTDMEENLVVRVDPSLLLD